MRLCKELMGRTPATSSKTERTSTTASIWPPPILLQTTVAVFTIDLESECSVYEGSVPCLMHLPTSAASARNLMTHETIA